MIYELRHYAPIDGMKRFVRDSLPICKKTGSKSGTSGKSGEWGNLVRHRVPNEEAVKRVWNDFVQTPEWKEIAHAPSRRARYRGARESGCSGRLSSS